ncbi:MAG: hypothetical protein ILNGONEN_00903 [Syntrophorhabdaceae bacterium]|nr:hypothetical protein [Syntrophorhabdaceae bacterium]HNQ62627.1 hypothetical protein [Syntrophorhabdaceae bacterium]HNZ57818.1 hypothetical protein [Syntrophorhabdaceae bacterium]HOG38876.1 hypothetical protein [Syntrophorhabdaceae bacterium]
MSKREDELINAGWAKRFVACEPRLTEMVEMYKEIGFKVHLEPLPSKEEIDAQGCNENECTACFDVDRDRYRIIFTKQMDDR